MFYPIESARIAFRTRVIGSAARPPGAVAYADPVDADALAAQRHPALDMAELVVVRRRHERRLARREAVRRMEARLREIEREATRRNVIDQLLFHPRLQNLHQTAAAYTVAEEAAVG